MPFGNNWTRNVSQSFQNTSFGRRILGNGPEGPPSGNSRDPPPGFDSNPRSAGGRSHGNGPYASNKGNGPGGSSTPGGSNPNERPQRDPSDQQSQGNQQSEETRNSNQEHPNDGDSIDSTAIYEDSLEIPETSSSSNQSVRRSGDATNDNGGESQDTASTSVLQALFASFERKLDAGFQNIEEFERKLDAGFQSLEELRSEVEQHAETTSESFERLEQRQTDLESSIESIRRADGRGSGGTNLNSRGQPFDSDETSIPLSGSNEINSNQIPSIRLSGANENTSNQIPESDLQRLLDQAALNTGCTYFTHDSDTTTSDYLKRTKHVESHKGSRIGFLKDGVLDLGKSSSDIRRLQQIIETTVGVMGLSDYCKFANADVLKLNCPLSIEQLRAEVSLRYDEDEAQRIDRENNLSPSERLLAVKRRGTVRTLSQSVIHKIENVLDTATYSHFVNTYRSDVTFTFNGVEFIDPAVFIYVINRAVRPLITNLTDNFRRDAGRIRATDFSDDSCMSAISKLQSLKEASDRNDCPISDEEWISFVFTACSHCRVENMKSKVLDFKVDYEKAVRKGETPPSFLELVRDIQIYELTLKGCDGWKLPVKSKASFAQAAKSAPKVTPKKEEVSKQSSAKSNSKSKEKETKEDKSWMSQPPSDGFTSKVHHGTTWYWHSKCQAWRKWKVADCNKCKKLSDDSSGSSSSKSAKKRAETAKAVRLEASQVALNALKAGDATAFFNEFTHYDVSDFLLVGFLLFLEVSKEVFWQEASNYDDSIDPDVKKRLDEREKEQRRRLQWLLSRLASSGSLDVLRYIPGLAPILSKTIHLTPWFISTYSKWRGSESESTVADGIARHAASFLAPLFLAAFFWLIPPRKPPDKPPDQSADVPSNDSDQPSDNPSDDPGGGPSDKESSSVPVLELNKKDKVRPHSGTKVRTGVLLDFSKSRLRSLVAWSFAALPFALNAVLDTGSSHHIFNDESVFVGDIAPVRGVTLRGIGGQIFAHGVGTVKLRMTDDNNDLVDLVIHNVLYVPESPMNLISPQKLGTRSGDTGIEPFIYTEGPITLFGWNKQVMKTVHHSPAFDLPLLFLNESLDSGGDTVRSPSSSGTFVTTASHSRCSRPFSSLDANGDPVLSTVPFDLGRDEPDSFQNLDPSCFTCTECAPDFSDNEDDDDLLSLFSSFNGVGTQLSDDDREFLRLHFKLNHLPFAQMQALAKEKVIPFKFRSPKYKPPPCPACLFGKQIRRRWRTSAETSGNLRRATCAGQVVHVDHLQSAQPGHVPQITGNLTRRRYVGALVFVDDFTDETYCHLVENFTDEESLLAKEAFERYMASHDVVVRHYHGDNGNFSNEAWTSDCDDKGQTYSFCGVSAHWQNGVVERRIGDLVPAARTMLLHGMKMYPKAVHDLYWPYALKAAERNRNLYKFGADGLSPRERLCKTKLKRDIRNEHCLFSPVFNLQKPLQTNPKGLPKWDPRSTVGIFVGMSPNHANNIALVLDLQSGYVSPQYHLVFDDQFQTVEYLKSGNVPPFWNDLAKFNTEEFTPPDPDERVTFNFDQDFANRAESLETASPDNDRRVRFVDEYERDVESVSEGATSTSSEGAAPGVSEGASQHENTFEILDTRTAGLRRSSRTSRAPEYYSPSLSVIGFVKHCLSSITRHVPASLDLETVTQSLPNLTATSSPLDEASVSLNFRSPDNFCLFSWIFATKAKKNADNDTFTLSQALKEDDWAEFAAAMKLEIEAHVSRGHWILRKRSTIGNAKVIKAIWSFKRKRRPCGLIIKHKARLCAHGGMQEHGKNYWDTYSPVVSWTTIKLMLTIAMIKHLHTRSIDFTLAFPQADVEVPIFMEIPFGFEVTGSSASYVLELKKNLYGLKQAGKVWFDHLSEGLQDLDFVPNKCDSCLYHRKDAHIIVYVDDCFIFAESKSVADDILAKLHDKFSLTDEGELGVDSVADYLGIQIHNHGASFEMKQPHLTSRVLTQIWGNKADGINHKWTPTEYKSILHKDVEGPLRKNDWSYRSVIGMLSYLCGTRPDILYATHSAARFAVDPKLSHELAVKRIGKYLAATKDKGIIMTPDASKGVECYVDASFVGDYCEQRSDDKSTLYSRTGYVIYFMGCPITWVSKMQTEITLSTTEAEYVALSQAMRDVIPFLDLIDELSTYFDFNHDKAKVKCRVYEDNNGCLELANNPRYRPRTKHIALKYHHFREQVQKGRIDVTRIDTKEQIADQFTKGLDRVTFEYLRKLLMGW